MHNAEVLDHTAEISLLWCALLNALVFGSAWLFSTRRMTTRRSQALLDAALIGYAVQYVAVGLPGMLGQLRPTTIVGTAVVLSIALIAASVFAKFRTTIPTTGTAWILPCAIAVFTAAFVLAFVHSQASLPVIANDALTYHFPAAAQWLQHGRIDLYPTWFFNPANTYSPLAGSTFIVWLIAPIGSDVLARFVEVPALLCVGLAVYRIIRQLGVGSPLAALTAAAAVLCRPMFLQSMMGKDDLFLAFFFLATLIAMTPERATEKFGSVRIGISLGLLLATKYTAFLTAPILLLTLSPSFFPTQAGSEALRRAGSTAVRPKASWLTVIAIVTLLAAPWYVRNVWLTGNPIFPLDVSVLGVHVFPGLFTTDASDALRPITSAISVVIGGSYGLPLPVAIILGIGWVAALVIGIARASRPCIETLRTGATPVRDGTPPLLRACTLGPILGIGLFYWRSPFPEVRFVVPVFLLMFAATGFAIDRAMKKSAFGTLCCMAAGVGLVAVSLTTIFVQRAIVAPLVAAAVAVAIAALLAFWSTRRWPAAIRASSFTAASVLLIAIAVYIFWTSYCRDYRQLLHALGGAYDQRYPAEEPLWRFIDEHVPADAVVAYTDLYMTYPMYGFNLQRRLIYVPTRPGVKTIADLPWLGRRLSGEKLVPLATQATLASPNRAVWLRNLKASGAKYLVIGRTPLEAPELVFATQDPQQFQLMFDTKGAIIYAVDKTPE